MKRLQGWLTFSQYFGAVVLGFLLMVPAVIYVGQQMYLRGMQAAISDTTWKNRAVSTPQFTNKLCYAWWFQATVKDRVLDPSVSKSK